MLVKFCLIAAASLPLLGFLRSSIDGKKPGYLMNPQTVVKNWQSENNWAARFSPVFAVFIFLFNLFAWGIYGFTSIVEFIGFLVGKIWWLLVWMWNEVLHPTVFALIRFLWHYLVVFSWKFFAFACAKIPEALKKENWFYALKKLLFFGGISALAGLAWLLTNHIIVLVIVSLVVFYLFQYTVFVTISFYRSDEFPESKIFLGLKLSVLWLAMSSVSTAILVALTRFSDVYIISGLSVLLIQVLLPFAVLFGLAFVATTCYLPAYMSEAGEDADMLKFLKVLLFRFPKLLASQAGQMIGIIVISVVPAIVLILLNLGIKQVTDKDLLAWGNHVLQVDYHIPAIIDNNKNSKILSEEITIISNKQDSLEEEFSQSIGTSRNELAETIGLKKNIQDRKIHTFERNAYVGENQSFSVPEIPGCAEYEWIITNAENNRIIRRTLASTTRDPGSLLLYHKWNAPGKYNVSIKTKAPCINELDETIQVEVVQMSPDLTSAELPENHYFVTREAADYAIDLINKQLKEYQQDKEMQLKSVENEKNVLVERLDHVKFSSGEHVRMLISKILGYVGLVLLVVLYLSSIWTYLVTYHYDMFGFEQEGKHFWVRQLEKLREKNPDQPLLGIFVLIIFAVLFVVIEFREFIFHLF
ncbi:MAG: hypothetical protein PHQ11_03380 [Paludibacter sp.]|nr:hypothetical protein [Paludibacter sp.]MDD4199727.1 hypothetical protein [Paludibacter sp.]MDD4429325.1 hypothetical protein [Paludibacter sp.]